MHGDNSLFINVSDGASKPQVRVRENERMGKSVAFICMPFDFMAVAHRFANTKIV